MKLSIVTPLYNQAPFLEATLKSVWHQAGDFDLEHIVVDGGSTDGSLAILKRYDQLYRSGAWACRCRSFSFKWWSRPDSGQAQAINRGFTISTGRILGWLNSDDTYLADSTLAKMQAAVQDSAADIVVGNALPVDGKGVLLHHPMYINKMADRQFQARLATLSRNNFIIQPACIFKKEVWEAHPLDESLHFLMDWDFWLKAYYSGYRFYKSDDVYAACRIHAGAKTVQAGDLKYVEGLRLFKRYNVWCLNRLYYYLYLVLLKLQNRPFFARPAGILITHGKTFRNLLVNRLRLY